MAKKSMQEEIIINFTDKGLPLIEKKLENIQKLIDTYNTKIEKSSKLSATLLKNIDNLKKTTKELTTHIKTYKNNLEKASQKDNFKNYNLLLTTIRQINQSSGKLLTTYTLFGKKVKEVAEKHITFSKQETLILNRLKDIVDKTNNFNTNLGKASKANSLITRSLEAQKNKVISINKESSKGVTIVNDRIKALNKEKIKLASIEKILKNMNNLKTSYSKISNNTTTHTQRRAGNTSTNNIDKANNKVNKYKKNLEELFELIEAYTIIPSDNGGKDKYIFPKKDLEIFRKEYNKALETFEKTGDYTALKELNERLKTATKNVMNLEYSLRSLNSSYNNGKIPFRTMSPAVSHFDPNTDKRAGIASTTQSNFYAKEAQEATKLLKRLETLRNQYEKNIRTLRMHLEARRKWASADDIKKAEKEIEKYEKALKKVVRTQDSLNEDLTYGQTDAGTIHKTAQAYLGLNNNLQQLNHSAIELRSNLNRTATGAWIRNITKNAIGYSMLYGAIYGISQVIRNSVTYVNEFNEGMMKLQAILNISPIYAKNLSNQLERLGTIYGGDIKDINGVATALARAGIETKNLTKATEITLQMAKLTGDTYESSSGALISYMTTYKDTGVSVKQLGEELAYVANASKLSTEDIATFSNYALQTAKAVGITRHTMEALAIAMSNAGVRAETIGTNLRRLGTIATTNATSVKNLFLSLGTTQEVFARQLAKGGKTSEKAMRDLIKSLSSLSKQEFMEVTQGMEVLTKQTLTNLRETGVSALSYLDDLNSGVEGNLDRATIITDSYRGSWERLGNSFGQVFNKLSEDLFPIIQKLALHTINFLNELHTKMPVIKKAFSDLTDTIENLGKVFLTIFGVGVLVKLARTGTAVSEVATKFKSVKWIIESIWALFKRNPIVMAFSMATGALMYFYDKAESGNEVINKALQKQNDLQIKQQEAMIKTNDLVEERKILMDKLNQSLLNNPNVKDNKEAQSLYTQIEAINTKIKLQKEYQDALNDESSKLNQLLETRKKELALIMKQKTLTLKDVENSARSLFGNSFVNSAISNFKKVSAVFKKLFKAPQQGSKTQSSTSSATHTNKPLFVLKDKDIQKLKQLNNYLIKLKKSGEDVTATTQKFNKVLEDTINKGLKATHTRANNVFTGISANTKNSDLGKKVNNLLEDLKKAKPDNLLAIRKALLDIQIAGENDKAKMKELSPVINMVGNELAKYEKIYSLILNKKENKGNISPFSGNLKNEALQYLDILKQIQYATYKSAFNYRNSYTQIAPTNNMPAPQPVDEVGTINTKIDSIAGADNTLKSFKNIFKVTNDINTAIRKVTQNLNKLKYTDKALYNKAKKILRLEIQKAKIIAKQKEAYNKMVIETSIAQGKISGDMVEFYNMIEQKREDIGLIDYASDKEKANAFFEWYKTKIDSMNTKAQNTSKGVALYSGISGAGNPLGSQLANDTIQIYSHYNEQNKIIEQAYSERENVISAGHERISQMQQAGLINQSEATQAENDLVLAHTENSTQRATQMQQMRFSTQLGMTANYINSLSNTFEQMRQSGYMKDKKSFETYKKMQVALTILSTYAASAQVMASPAIPDPFTKQVIAGTIIAQGLMRLAIIKAQKYHTGGLVDKDDIKRGGMGGLRKDEVPAILQQGEYVLSRNDMKAISNVSSPNVNVTANAPSPEVVIVNSVDDERFKEYLESREGREVINNVV